MITELAKKLIHENEGDRLTVYRDPVGILTIGRGRNLEDRGITQDESDYLLRNDIAEAHDRLSDEFAFFARLSDPRRLVLMDMYHNLGLKGLLGFRKMLTALQHGDYDTASDELMNSRYWNQVGVRAQRNYCMIRYNRYYTRPQAKK